jgi:hypothetical protein
MPRRFRGGASIALLVLLTALIAACGGGGIKVPGGVTPSLGEGSPRSFLMGFSSLPHDTGEDAYIEAFRDAAQAGEVVFIQRAPPWEDFVPGGTVSSRTERLTRLEKDLAKAYNLKVFLAVDPTEPSDRGRLAGLPDSLRGKDFADENVRAAFIAYAKYLALNYKPAYLALGVEVDMFFNRRGDEAFRTFQSLYFQAYDAVKSVSPDTLVFPTFQYEDMIGLLSGTLPAWSLIDRFDPKIDMVAVSSFPGFVLSKAADMPSDYYAPLQQHMLRPLAFVSTGWTSQVSENEQASFLSRALSSAESLEARLFVWYLSRDPAQGPDNSFGPLALMGLKDTNGQPKVGWSLWRRIFDRPVAQ